MLKWLPILVIFSTCTACQTLSSWFGTSPASVQVVEVPQKGFSRGFHGTVANQSTVYIFGGMSDASEALPPVISHGWRYDHDTSEWHPLHSENEPTPRFAHAMAASPDGLFIWGGQGTGGAILADGAFYHQKSRRWRPLPKPPVAGRRFSEAVWTGKEFLLIGGAGQGDDLDQVLGYDPTSNSWHRRPALPDGSRWGHGVVSTGQWLLVWGGVSSDGIRQRGWSYDINRHTWSEIPREGQPTPRSNHSATAVAGKMLVWGGSDGQTRRNDGGVYDPVTQAWTPLRPLPGTAGRSGHAAAANNNGVLVWGGRNSQNKFLSDGFFLDLSNDSWSPFHPIELSPRALHTMVTIQNKILLVGGFGPAEGFNFHYFGDAYWLNPGTAQSRPLPTCEEDPCGE